MLYRGKLSANGQSPNKPHIVQSPVAVTPITFLLILSQNAKIRQQHFNDRLQVKRRQSRDYSYRWYWRKFRRKRMLENAAALMQVFFQECSVKNATGTGVYCTLNKQHVYCRSVAVVPVTTFLLIQSKREGTAKAFRR